MALALHHVFEILQFSASKPSTAREVRGIVTTAISLLSGWRRSYVQATECQNYALRKFRGSGVQSHLRSIWLAWQSAWQVQ